MNIANIVVATLKGLKPGCPKVADAQSQELDKVNEILLAE